MPDVRLCHGLHRPAEQVAELAGRCAAFLDVLPPGSVVGGITAARLHGLWLPLPGPRERLEFVLTRAGTFPRELAGTRRREFRLRRRSVPADEIVEVAGLPVVNEARTWVHVAQTLSIEDLVAAGDSLLRGATAEYADLVASVATARRQRGVVRAREALDLLDGRSRSRPESHLRCHLVRSGLPRPEVNRPIRDEHGNWLAEPDLHYERARLALEYNGAGHATVDKMRADITRTLDVIGGRWLTVTFGATEVFGRPHTLAPYVRALLNDRDPGWWRRPL